MGLRPLAGGHGRCSAAEDITAWSTRARREAGIGFIPEDRHRQGMLLEAPLWENRILGHQTRPPAVKGVFIDRRAPAPTPSGSCGSTTSGPPAPTPSPSPCPAATSRS